MLEGDGAEAVVPLEKNTGWIRKVANQIHNFVIETKDTSKDIAGNVSSDTSKGIFTAIKSEIGQRINNLEVLVAELIETLKRLP